MTRLAGRYELQRRLAEGGMAEVWLAVAHGDAGFTRRVAIKQLFARQEEDGGAFERMFLDEARITSRLHHAGIVSILDFGVEAGRAFQVLELIDGFDVWRLAKWGRAMSKPMPVALALHVCATVGHALHFAHAATSDDGKPLNIVHRDVSPQNVLVSRGGDVKLSDFGIALAEGRTEKTVGGVARGKPAYMAPEQAIRGSLDARTDVFALGCVLHALLTGESALRDENALVDLLAGQELTLSFDVHPELRDVIARATRRNKAERYESAEAFALACSAIAVREAAGAEPRKALAEWVASVAPSRDAFIEQATPMVPSKPVVASSPKPTRRAWVPFLVVGLAGVTGVGVSVLFSEPQPLPPPPVVLKPVVDTQPKVEAEVPAPEKSFVPDASTPAPTEGVVRPKVPTKVIPAVVVETGTGLISIGGEALLRGEVKVDGKSVGFAPGRFEVSVGPHKLEVVTPDGQKHVRDVTVTRLHTPSSPLSWVE
ncbi:MAG: serine/threonine-protein kinase [Archangium sp.]